MRLRVLPFVLALFATGLFAQSFTPVRELKNLSPAAVDKLHTLETLSALPPGDWRFHAGDLPHGESPTLDDSAWPLVPAPTSRATRVKAPRDAVWYRRLIEVPKTLHGYDLTGARIWFQFQADANGPMPQIVYFNGRRVALGDDLEPIVLFEPAHPGDKVLVAVKLLHTVDDKTFTGVTLRIEPLDTARLAFDDLRQEIITAANLLPSLPKPRMDLLPTVEAAAAAIDTTALAAGNQAAFDASLRNAQSILAPLHAVLAPLTVDLAGNSHIDAAWLWPRSETIDVVRRTFTTALQLMNEYPGYTFTQSAAQYSEWMADKYPDLNAQIKQRVKEGRWEIVGGMWVEPDLNMPDGESLVRQLLLGQRTFQQQYGVTARIGWNPDSFGYNWQLPQIYKRSGLDYFVTQKMHWNDTNQLPFRLFWWQSPDGSKVLTYFPTDYVHDNVNPTRLSADFAESAARNPGSVEHLDLYGIGDHGGGPTRSILDQADHWIALSAQSNHSIARSGQVDHSVAQSANPSLAPSPSKNNAVILSEAKDLCIPAAAQNPSLCSPPAALPTIHYSTAQSYFTTIEQHLNPTSPIWNYTTIAKGYTPPPAAGANIGLPTWNDELYFEYHRGVMTTQAAHKRNMRVSETQTLDAEKLASLAWLQGATYPSADLTENWKKITFNQFHDLAAGSGIAVIYRDAQKDFTEVSNANHQIDESALNTIDARIDTSVKTGVPILVANTLAWPRTELVTLHIGLPKATNAITLTNAKGVTIPAQVTNHIAGTNEFEVLALVSVPALGYTVLHAEIDKQSVSPNSPSVIMNENASSFILSNIYMNITINKKTGCIAELSPLGVAVTTSDYLAPNACANQLQTYADTPQRYDAWNIDPGTLDGKMTPIDTLDSIKILTGGPLRKTIRITRTWSKSHFIQDISLDAGSDVVNIATDVDWHETHVLLKAAFPLAATSAKATYEIPYGAIQRPTARNNSWEKAQFEVPALRWADLGDEHQGVSILNDSKYGYDALGNTLRLTLLRSPTWPDPDADRGLQHFTYAIYPHTGPWQSAQTVHRGYELNTPLTAQQVFPHTGTLPATHSFASIPEPNVILTAIKKAEDANRGPHTAQSPGGVDNALIFRFYESSGQGTDAHLHIPPGALYAIETNLMETPIPNGPHLPLTRHSEDTDTVTLPIKPFEIRTIQVVYPAPPIVSEK